MMLTTVHVEDNVHSLALLAKQDFASPATNAEPRNASFDCFSCGTGTLQFEMLRGRTECSVCAASDDTLRRVYLCCNNCNVNLCVQNQASCYTMLFTAPAAVIWKQSNWEIQWARYLCHLLLSNNQEGFLPEISKRVNNEVARQTDTNIDRNLSMQAQEALIRAVVLFWPKLELQVRDWFEWLLKCHTNLSGYAFRTAMRYTHLSTFAIELSSRVRLGEEWATLSLVQACKYGNLEAVRWILNETKADPSFDDCEALRIAAVNGHPDIVELMLRNAQVDPSVLSNEAVRFAAENGHASVVNILMQDKRVNPSALFNEALRKAAEHGYEEVVTLLKQDNRVDPTALFNEALRRAAENGFVNIVRFLLDDERVDPTAFNNYALRYAARNGHLDVVELLVTDKRMDLTARSNEAVVSAARNGYTDVVRFLLQDERVILTGTECIDLYSFSKVQCLDLIFKTYGSVLCYLDFTCVHFSCHFREELSLRHVAVSQLIGAWCLDESIVILPRNLICDILTEWTILNWEK